ncbi:hypothetical protein GCM10020216_001470 [Nonomuraea helvata]
MRIPHRTYPPGAAGLSKWVFWPSASPTFDRRPDGRLASHSPQSRPSAPLTTTPAIGSQALRLGPSVLRDRPADPILLDNPSQIIRGDRVTHLVHDVAKR